MRYLTLSADYLEPSLVGAADDFATVESLGLTSGLVDEIRRWNADYQKVVPATPSQRSAMQEEIARLDQTGQTLASKVADELSPAKVAYYSEGLSRLLP